MSEENKEKQKSLSVTDFYDLVFKIDSFRNLKKKEQGDYGCVFNCKTHNNNKKMNKKGNH